MRGDRVGVIGPNGSGKTTLIRLLLGELAPDVGTIRLGTGLEIAYFDQLREQLDPERSVFDSIADGADFVDGRRRAPARQRLSAGFPLSARSRANARARAVGR